MTGDPRGSVWRRWDPHIHAPGTILSDQFGGSGSLDEYLDRIEAAAPAIEAVGVTDYLTTTCYEAVLAAKQDDGRLGGVSLVFPNVEIRLSIGTKKSKGINMHLLMSPDDPDHLAHLHRFLARLNFEYKRDKYACTSSDLIRLGRAHDSSATDDLSALKAGVNQFKVDFRQLKAEYEDSDWMRSNSVVAVAGSSTDGTAGLQTSDASFAALRKEIERFAHIIFSGNEKQAQFWRGDGAASTEEMDREYGGCKPCLHGSDAHCLTDVGSPDLDRLTWLKGDAIFETLRQACIEPATRVFVGPVPAEIQNPERTIANIATVGTPWLLDGGLPINPGLVAIIGARGSGKTALADLLAQAGGNDLALRTDDSFLTRARPFLEDAQVVAEWSDGAIEPRPIISWTSGEDADVHYLTQQFVERLCSPEGATDELLSEIEKVVFSAHEPETRMEATSFADLLEARVGDTRRQRDYLRERTDRISQDVLAERQRIQQLPGKKKALEQLTTRVEADRKSRDSIVSSGEKERAHYYERLRVAIDVRERAIQALGKRGQSLQHLDAAIDQHRTSVFPDIARRLHAEFAPLSLSVEEWAAFEIQFAGDPGGIVDAKLTEVRTSAERLKAGDSEVQPTISSTQAELQTAPLAVLKQCFAAVADEIGIDSKNAQRLKTLNERVAATELEIEKAKRDVEYFEGAQERLKALVKDRSACYERFFDLVVAEEAILRELYEPLEAQLTNAPETVGRLRLVVVRRVDLEGWASRGEDLLDLRRKGRFQGRGSLRQFALTSLVPIWERGSASEVAEAMASFRAANDGELIAHANVDRATDPVGFEQWTLDIGRWLYSTDHITVTYSFEYEGLPLAQLSPGTRGIVLLLLYLALDREDHRPLIIDQPEENLDPRSVFAELVELFRTARFRRQVIIVTHNANLVVNTDVDQVIVASCVRQGEGEPPLFAYKCGSLEDGGIRADVCEILEGGEAAFRERAKRLRVSRY